LELYCYASIFYSTPEDVAEKAATLQHNYNHRLDAVRRDTKLSDEGKTERLAAEYQQHATAMTELPQVPEILVNTAICCAGFNTVWTILPAITGCGA
jgi:hypothetical protein